MAEPFVSESFISKAHKFLYPSPLFKLFSSLGILGLLVGGAEVVFLTGGTHLAYLHLLYIPIILAGFLFSIPGGLLVAILAIAILGPFMPSNIELNIPQPLSSWILRGFFFCGVGILSGVGSAIFRSYIQELEKKFTTDPITNLPNVGGLLKVFSENIVETNVSTNIMAIEIFYMDEIDQAFGPEGKNLLITAIKQRLQSFLPKKVHIGIIDTKSFCLLIPDSLDIQEILPLCKQELGKTYMVENVPMFVELRYGISRFPEDGLNLPTLIRKAKIAVAKSVKFGRDQAFFDREEASQIQKNIKILHSLRQSIESKLMSLHYQPKIDLTTNKPIGFEALARWSHPTLGRIAPAEFIPLIERTLLINPFTDWVLEEAIQQTKQWHSKGFNQTISVNFSMKNFLDSEIVNRVLNILKKHQFPAEYLEVEITESAIAQNITAASDLMHTLRENGVKIAVDDFGTGQSSLQYLFKLPLDVLKIDRIFIAEMTSNAGAAAIVRSAILLGHELNLTVVAEGVENKNELDMLKKFGCDAIQGYYMSPPMEVHEATDWLYSSMSVRPPSSKVTKTVP